MVGIYYAAVEDDPLTSGPGGRVSASGKVGTIQGEDGRRRRMAFIGDEAYCAACGSTGAITYGATGLRDQRRLLDRVNGGRRQAVGGDIVLCKCSTHPRIIAQYGRSWVIRDQGKEAGVAIAKAPVQRPTLDEQFGLTDATGKVLANTYYTIRTHSGEMRHGITDSQGRSERYETEDAQPVRIYLGHRQES